MTPFHIPPPYARRRDRRTAVPPGETGQQSRVGLDQHKSMRDIHTDARNRLDGVNVEKLTYIHFNGLQFKLTRTEEKKVQLGLDDAKDAKDA